MTVDSIIPAGSPTLIRSGVIARGLCVPTHVVRAMVARGQLQKPLRLSRNL